MASRKQKGSLEQRVLKFIRANSLVQPGQKLVVAVSGGPDSVCLMHILFKLQKELPISLHVAHLDHALRGEESAGDARYVAELAQKLGIPATIEKRAVKTYQKARRLSLEEAAREVRYVFLAETAGAVGANCVAAGHTLNDQAETILLHIIRGAGTRGLRGLQPSQTLLFADRRIEIIRPLLEVRREETVAYCKLHRLSPRTDSSNQSTDLLRNRVRHELLPLLRDYNTGIVDSLLRISRIAADDLVFLKAESEKAWKRIVRRQKGTVIFDKPAFLSLAPALRRQLLRKAIEGLLGTLKDIETRHIEEIFSSLAKPAGRCIDLPEGLVFSIEYDRFLLGFQPEKLSPFPVLPGEYRLTIPGVTNLPGWRIEAALTTPEKTGNTPDNPDAFTACLDCEKTGPKIRVRTLRRGDRFQPLGLGQEKKVARFMLDAHVPRLWRPGIPIFYTPRQIVWIAGYRLDERVKVTSATRQVLCIKLCKT
jgi:tRNA(Ile)-lysidine synthase